MPTAIREINLSGFRGFRHLHVDQLTRVNLFVGQNNTGKTSILEAVEILTTGTPEGLLRSPVRRRERILVTVEERLSSEIDPSHLFYGHSLTLGAHFKIQSAGDDSRWVDCQVVRVDPYELNESRQRNFLVDFSGTIDAIRFQSARTKQSLLQISPFGGISGVPSHPALPDLTKEIVAPVNFLGTEPIENFRLSQLWDGIVLTPAEDEVTAALRLIEPKVERIAFLAVGRSARTTFLKLSGDEQRIPLGSAGDGLKRLLYLTLNLFSSRDGFLLVDEIDTGLHYTVMADMWRLVIETARRLNVQVFATTHSQDCVRALAWIQDLNPEFASEVILHRIEKESHNTVAYSLDELAVAARHHVEVR